LFVFVTACSCCRAEAQTTFTEVGAQAGVNITGWGFNSTFQDYDADGDPDLLVGTQYVNYLFRNEGTGSFTNVIGSTGITGSERHDFAFGDYDNDGDLDIYNYNGTSSPILWRSNGAGYFVDVTSAAGLGATGAIVMHAGFVDVDADGLLDLFLVRVTPHVPVAQAGQRFLFHNNGNGTFTDVTSSSGLASANLCGSFSFCDYDADGDKDLALVATGAALSTYHTWIHNNDGTGVFTDVTTSAGVAQSSLLRSTDVSWEDYDNDGDFDLFISPDTGVARLYSNNGNGTFTDVSSAAGLARSYANSASSLSADLDNDGDIDVAMHEHSGNEFFLWNNGQGVFTEADAGFDTGTRWAWSWGDHDGDGDVDFYASPYSEPGALYQNTGNDNRWLQVRLQALTGNATGIGARIRLVSGGTSRVQEVGKANGRSGHAPLTLHFGLGQATSVDSLMVWWPSGTVQIVRNIPTDQVLLVREATPPDLQIAGKMAFMSNRDGGNWDQYTMFPDGTNVTRLTDNSGVDHQSKWSPDGAGLVFFTDRDGNYEIYVMNADGSNQTRLTSNAVRDESPVWSPDGAKIAYVSGAMPGANGDIYTVNPDGTGQARLTTNANPYALSWSPDGTKIAYQSSRNGNVDIYTANVADGSNEARLTTNAANDVQPYWSPDGTKLLFMSWRDDPLCDIYVMDADGGNQIRVVNNPAEDRMPCWSPDGTRIAFSSWRETSNNLDEIYVANADGTGPVRITDNGAYDGATSWSDGFRRIGSASVGTQVSRTMTVENKGAATLNVSSITSSDEQFSVNPSSFSVAAGSSQSVSVTFSATTAGTRYTTLTLNSNDPDAPVARLIVNGTGREVVVSIPDTTARYLQALSLPVRVSDTSGEGIVSAEAFVTYDGDLLRSPVVEAGGLLTPNWTVESHVLPGMGTAPDTLRVAMATDDDTLAGAGSLANLRFQVADVRHPTSTSVRLEHVLFNAGSPGNVRDYGSVTVVGTDGGIDSAPPVVLPRHPIQVTVTEADEDRDTVAVDSVRVTVWNGSQMEGLWALETGHHTGVFQGSIGTVFSRAPTSGDGVIQAKAGDRIAFSYVDSLTAAGTTIGRVDTTRVIGGRNGTVRPTVVVQPGDTVRVKVVDDDLVGSVPAVLHNPRTAETDTVSLALVSGADSVFYGRGFTEGGSGAGPGGDDRIRLNKGDSVMVVYVDTLTAEGGVDTLRWGVRAVDPFGDADGNGLVQAYDASRVLYHRLHPYLTGLDSLAANVDTLAPYGPITAYDAALVLQKRVGRIWRFPVQSPGSVNQPQPESRQTPKAVVTERLVEVRQGQATVAVWLEDRAGVVSAELELEGVAGPVRLGEGLGEYLVAWDGANGRLRVVLAGAEAVSGPGELIRLESSGAATPRLTGVVLNDGMVGVRLGSGVLDVSPRQYALHGAVPNPFNPSTVVRYELPEAVTVRLEVFDAVGQRMRVLASGERSAGAYGVEWDGRNDAGQPVSSGVYLCRLQAGRFSQVQRMVLMK
jgi:Tol biopolymer transport system component